MAQYKKITDGKNKSFRQNKDNKLEKGRSRNTASFLPKRETCDLPKNHVALYGKHAVFSAITNKKRTLYKLLITENKLTELEEYLNKENFKLPKDLNIQTCHTKDLIEFVDEEAVHQGIVLFCSALPRLKLDTFLEKYQQNKGFPFILILDQITDPHNIGALIRSASAFGFKGIVVPQRNTPKDSSIIAKTSVGTCENIDLIEVNNINDAIKDLKEAGYWIAGLDGYATSYINELDISENLALIVGSEGKGIRDLVKKNCDILTKIPMIEGVESLNASVAGSVAMYQIFVK